MNEIVLEESVIVAPVTVESGAVEPVAVVEQSAFQALGLSPEICQALESSGYTIPTGIQAGTIPELLRGRDVLGQAQTGTGKTAAFALPLLCRIDVNNPNTQVLVLTPTRELAIQVAESFEKYGQHLRGLRIAPIYGGSSYSTQIQALRRGAHIVVGTPGRVMDHMRENRLTLDGLQCLVLDEADEMLRMGFVDDVRWVLEQSPPHVQIALFSATMPSQIREIADRHLKDPHVVSIDVQQRTAATIRQRFVLAEPKRKFEALHRILETEPTDGTIIFVKTRVATVELAESLQELGYSAVAINGEIAQSQRERCIEQLKQGAFDILVATDVAARGLDVQRITHVINYDLPFDSEAYVHRIGRTGRAGRDGEAILLLTPRQQGFLRELERATRQRLEIMDVPSISQVNATRVERFKSKIAAALSETAIASSEFSAMERVITQCMADQSVDATKIATALALLSLNNKPFLLAEPERRGGTGRDRNRRDERPTNGFETSSRNSRERSRPEGDTRFEGPRSEGTRPEGARPEGARLEGRPGKDRPRRDMELGDSIEKHERERFRLEVGRTHGVRPGNIVGAIANEIGLDSNLIGQITIYDEFTSVFLPAGMPREVFKTLGQAWVVGRQLRISKWKDQAATRNKPKKQKQ
ncbi:MAG: DEAD/DEAH box helicase [Pirellula sp.]|jgi:ATP-dependent RNA helicase DeaD|nr:DEAD/DEAH box helicase [Pirellula sp.]